MGINHEVVLSMGKDAGEVPPEAVVVQLHDYIEERNNPVEPMNVEVASHPEEVALGRFALFSLGVVR